MATAKGIATGNRATEISPPVSASWGSHSATRVLPEDQQQQETQHGPVSTSPARQSNSPLVRPSRREYRVYKRRFIGLGHLVLLNIMVSWNWLSYSPVAALSAEYLNTTETVVNWFSIAFLFAFCLGAPFTIYALNKGGPRSSVMVASCLILIGTWIRYIDTRNTYLGGVILGQILIGLAQPFVLSAPTRYSNLWFSDAGRVTATAVASLANPFGGAIAQLVNPLWASEASDIANMILYISIMSTIVCLLSMFIPKGPPTPPRASAASLIEKSPRQNPDGLAEGPKRPASLRGDLGILVSSVRKVVRSVPNLCIIIPFWTFVGLFNSFSSLLPQILLPYGFSEIEAGIGGAVLILTGLVAAAVAAPLIDRSKAYLCYITTAVPIIGAAYLVFVFVPAVGNQIFLCCILALLGAASFSLVPVALEFLVEISWPLSPEMGSTVCWTGGQLLGGIFIVVQNALKAAPSAHPPFHMHRAVIFQTVIACVVVPLPLALRTKWVPVQRARMELDHRPALP